MFTFSGSRIYLFLKRMFSSLCVHSGCLKAVQGSWGVVASVASQVALAAALGWEVLSQGFGWDVSSQHPADTAWECLKQ